MVPYQWRGVVGGGLVGVVLVLAGCAWHIREGDRAPLFGAAAAIWSGLLGFVLAAQSILLGYWERGDILKTVKENRRLRGQLWGSFHIAIYVLGLSGLLAFVSLLPWPAESEPWFLGANTLASGAAVGAVVTCISLLRKITLLVTEPDED